MDEKVLKLLERAIAENLSNERVSYIMGVNGYEQSAIDAALGELKKKRPSQDQSSQQASASTASTASPIAPKQERTPSGLQLPEPSVPQFFQKAYGAKPAELPIPQKPGPQIEYVEDKKGNVVARDKRTGQITYSDQPSLSPEARQNIEERVLSGQVQTAPVEVPEPEVTATDWFGDKWNGLIEGVETFAANMRDENSMNGQAIADFIEDKKQDKPELYQLYEQSLEDSKKRGYNDEFARGIAANAAYMQFYQKDKGIENEVLPYVRQKGRDIAVERFGVEIDDKIQKELKDRFFSGAVRGLATSLPAMLTSASTMGMSFFDMAYSGAEEQLAIQLAENPQLEMTKSEQETYKVAVAGIEGVLEKVGLANTLKGNPMLKRALTGKVLTRLAGLGDDAGAEAFEKIVKEEARGLGGYVRKVAAGAMSEFETGALQQLSNDLINQYVTDSNGQNVFQPKTTKEIIKDVLYAGAQEAVGGGIISGTIGAFQKPGLDMTKEEFDNGINFAQNIKLERVDEFLKGQVSAGQITEEQAVSTLGRVKEFKDAAAKIPDELTDDAKYQIFQLITQKQGLQKNSAGKDEAIQERVKQKVDAINQQIQQVYDSQTQQPVSGTVQKGEIIGQVFQPGTSTEKASPSGVLQTPQAEVDVQFYAPTFTVDPLGRAVVSPEKDNSVVSSLGNVRPTQEVTEEDASELNRVFNVAKNAVPDGTKVVVHNSLESLLNSNPKAAQLYVDGKGTAKAYWNSSAKEFHVLSRGAVEQYNAATGGDISYAKQYVHEVVHPILNTLITEDAEVQSRLFTEIESMAKSGNAVAQRAINFGRKYAESKQQDETVTEFFALMAQPDALKSFDKNFKQRIKDFFNELFVRLGMDIKLDTDQDLYTMARNIDLAARTGNAIVFPKTNAAYQARSLQASLDSTPAGSRLFNEPLAGVDEIIQEYVTKNNIPYRPGKRIYTIDKERAKAIGQAYDVMRHEPSNPEVKRSYEALAKETLAQHQLILENGYEVEINNEEPYKNSAEMIADLRDNKRMRIFSTEAGFGDEPITDDQRAENPMLRDSGYRDANGNVLLVNDVFRFVHDFFGHAERGNSFGPVGEENAWDAHSRMYTNLARKAMTSETRGQNSWVNFSGVNEEAFKLRDKARKLRTQGRTDEASKLVSQVYEMMRFAEQKNGLLPDAFVANDYDELEFSMDEKTVDIRDGAASVRFVNANKTFVKQREIVYAERVLEKNPMFMFTGTEKIESAEDVAYLFRHLESAVSENAFVTFSNPKNGEFRVQWLGTGGTTSQVIDTKQILAAYQNFAEDLGTSQLSVVLVHNHPSGTLKASQEDVKMLEKLRESFKLTDAKIEDGVIINLDSGNFVTFNETANDFSGVRSNKVTSQEIPYDVFSFNRQVLYTPSSELAKITSLNDVGEFLSKFKRGRHEKLGYFVMNQQNKITYAAVMDPNKMVSDAARELSSDVGRYGEAVIIFGTDKERVDALKNRVSSSLSSFNASILDTVVITDSEEYLEFESSKYGGTSTFQKSGITGEIDFSLDNPIDFDKPFPVFMPSQKIEDALFAINPNHNPEITPAELFELAKSDKSYKNQIYTLAVAKAMRDKVDSNSNDYNILSRIIFGSEWDGKKQKTQDPFSYHKDTPFLYHFTSARNLSNILGHQPKFELLGRSLKGNRLVNDEFAGEIFINPRKAASQYQEYEKALADYDNKSRDFVRKVLSIENVNPLLELFGLKVDELRNYANRKIDSIAVDARGASGLESLSSEKIGKQPRAYDYIKYFSSIDEVKSRLTDEILEEYDVEEGKDGIVLLSPKTQNYGFNIFENLSTTSLPFFNVRGFSTMKGTGVQGYNGRTVYFSDSNSRIVLKKPSELNKLGIKTEPGSDDNGTYAGEYEAVLYPKDYDDANYIGAVEQVEIFGDVRKSEYEAIKNAQAVLGFKLIEADVNLVSDDADISFSLDDIPSVTTDAPNSIKNAIAFASESSFSNKLDFKKALQERFKSTEKEIKKQYGIKSFTQHDKSLANYLVDSYVNETVIAIQSYPDALGWYDAKTKAAMSIMSLIHPELETDVAAQAAFKIAVAVTSNGNKVFDNFKEADRQYKYYKKNGKFDSKYSIGTQSKGIKDTFKFTNMVLEKMSMENFATFLTSKFNAGDLKYIKGGKKTPLLSGFTVDTEVYGASIFGAKIGNGFFMNLYGEFDQLTMDRWFMRQYGRLTGTLLDIDPAKIRTGKARLSQSLKALTATEKKTLASVIPSFKSLNIVELSYAINKASIDKDKRTTLSSTPALDELRKAGNSLAKNDSGEVEAPSGGSQRKFIVGVFNEVQRRLREDAGIEITIADLQAVNWYPEKALYQTFQEGRGEADGATETSDNEQPDYESAAKRLALENGITENEIKNATGKQRGESARESIAARAKQLTGDSVKPSVIQLAEAILKVKSGQEDGETFFSIDEGIDWFVSPEGKGDPAISRRDTQLEEAAQELRDGKITNEDFRFMVKALSPVEPISRFFAPATQERMASALSKDKVPSLNAPVKEGQTVALRLDIPAYINSNTWVVSVHDGTTTSGKVISYQNVARITDVVFKSNPLAALNIAAGEAKSTIGRMFGKYAKLDGATPDERAETAKSIVSRIWNSPEWKQIGMNPTRASYFYDRATARPVVAAEEVIQVGGLVYAKNPVYTRWNDPRFEVKGYNDSNGEPIYFSVDEASNLRQTISRTVNRFNPETRARIMANPGSYYTRQSLKAIKGNLENMSDDELLENMTAEGLNTVSRTAAVGKGENDISVLAAVELINRKVSNGEDVSELLVDLAQLGTTVGRMLRHFAELKSSSPMGIVETVRAALKRADRVMTATQEQNLTAIAERFIAAQQKVKALRDQIELVFDSATESELNNATKELDKVTRELNAFTSVIVPKKVMDLLSTTIQGNLLTPMSQVTNVGANMIQAVTSIPVKGFETLFSKITSAFTSSKPRSFSASVMAMPYAIKQAGVGTLEALQIIIRGGASTEKIVHTGFMPAASLLAALSDTKFASMVNSTFGKEVIKSDVLPRLANGNIAAADRAKALYEGLFGAAPEVMFRFLSLGDKPFFRFSEAMQLAQEANKLGLKGEARRNFMKYPTKKAMAAAEKAGKTITFQQDNQVANIIFQLQKSIGKVPIVGSMLEFMLKVSLPYVKTPANIFSETMKFALPVYGVATATDKFFKKDYDGGASDLAKAAVGQMIIAAANYLIVNGIITAAFDDEEESERAMMYLKQPPSSINKDALARLLNGESPEYRDGDRFARYDKLGIPGMVMGARANAVKRAGGTANEEGLYVGEESMFKPVQVIWDQLSMPVSTLQFMNEQSFLAGTNSLLNVLSGEASERDVEKWLENTFRSLTAIPFPNTLSAVHRGYREYMPNITSDNVSNKFRYVVQDRMFDTDGVPVRVTPLGEKIPQTPEGANKFMYNLVDFTKSMKTSSDKVWGELYRVYEATEDPDVAPNFPTKLTRLPSETPGGEKIKGWNAEVEREWRLEMQRLQEIHGQGKMELLENLFKSDSYNQADNEQKAKMIVDLYNDYNRGQRTIKSPFGRMPSLKPRFEWKLEYEKVEQKFLE